MTIAIPGDYDGDIREYVKKVMEPYRTQWWDWWELEHWSWAKDEDRYGNPGHEMSYIDLEGQYHSAHLPDAIASDGERGANIPTEIWDEMFIEWVGSNPKGTKLQDVKVKW